MVAVFTLYKSAMHGTIIYASVYLLTNLALGFGINIEHLSLAASKNNETLNSTYLPSSISEVEEIKNESVRLGNSTAKEKYVKRYELPPNYNHWVSPVISSGDDQRVHVSVGVLIYAMRSVDELQEDLTLELDLKTRWRDELIQEFDKRSANEIMAVNSVPYISLDSSYLKKIWWPSIIFNDIVSITNPNLHTTVYPKPVQLRVYSGGIMQMITRLVVKLYCPMDFTYYPADTQTCKIRIRSHASSNNDMLLNWNDVLTAKDNKFIPFDVYLADRSDGSFNKFLHEIKTTTFRNPLEQRDTPESYTVLEFSLSAKRKFTFHLLQTFIPSAFLILITWLTFFLPTSMLEVRIGITMTTLLTLTAMFSSIKEYTPHVSYIKAIDIWILFCIIIVFITLFEFAVLVWLRKTIEKNMVEKNGRSLLKTVIIRMRPELRQTLNSVGSKEDTEVSRSNTQRQKLLVYRKITKAADMYGFLFVAGAFVTFNVTFWTWLLVASNYFKLDANLDNNAEL